MATLRVRYRDGSEDEWELHERMQLEPLARAMHERMARGGGVAFGVESRSQRPSDFAFIGLRFSDIIMWEIDGFVDEEWLATIWQPPAE